jgi:NitT/TauT family transport system permease protein
VLLLCGVYTLLSVRQHRINPNDTTIPSWTQIGQGIKKSVTPQPGSGDVMLLDDGTATYVRLAEGLLIAVAAALVAGIAMGCYTPVESLLQTPLSIAAKIPPTAMLAVFFVLVGINQGFFIAMIVFGVTPTLAQAIYQSAKKDVPEELLNKAATLGASQGEQVWNVVFKQVLPRLIEAVRLQVGPAMVFLIAAEYVVADVGFGYRLRLEGRKVNFNIVYFYLALLGASGFLIDYALVTTRRKLCPWFGR